MIKVEHLGKIYGKGSETAFQALTDIHLEVSRGEMTAIIGKSGAGKSTLLYILSCIEGYEEGGYYLDGMLMKNRSEKELATIRNEKIGLVMQDFALVEEFSVIENVMLPLDFAKQKPKNATEIALNTLESVGMREYAQKPVKKLSGGQKQRVAIARAIVREPLLILADEPTGALDSKTSMEIMRVFAELNRQGKTIIIVTHDPTVANQCSRIIEISDGRIVSP